MINFILKILSGMVFALGVSFGSNLRLLESNLDFFLTFVGISLMFVIALSLWELSFELDEEEEARG